MEHLTNLNYSIGYYRRWTTLDTVFVVPAVICSMLQIYGLAFLILIIYLIVYIAVRSVKVSPVNNSAKSLIVSKSEWLKYRQYNHLSVWIQWRKSMVNKHFN